MNLLDHYRRNNTQLLGRNEGKLKSYESCSDLRAWSHDCRKRSCYLREWIRSDMPLCAFPVSTILGFFRAMTYKRNARVTPHCQPDCKSKVILDSIIASCEVIRQCLKADESLEKFFIEEELETSHWPCERCLEALKSIKMFWKIMLEKVFSVNITTNNGFEDTTFCTNHSVCEMARMWKRDMVQQALYVKTITPQLLCPPTCQSKSKKSSIGRISCSRIPAPCSEGDNRGLSCTASKSSTGIKRCLKRVLLESNSNYNMHKSCRKLHICSSDCSANRRSSYCSMQKSKTSNSHECSCRCRHKSRHHSHVCTSNCSLLKNCRETHHCSSNSDLLSKHKLFDCTPQSNVHDTKNHSPHNHSHSPHICNSICNISKECQMSPCSSMTKLKTKSPVRICRCTSAKLRTSDACCGTSSCSIQTKTVTENKYSLQRSYNKQREEIEKLRKENCSLKCELKTLQLGKCSWNAMYRPVHLSLVKDETAIVPKPFESSIEDSWSNNSAKDADSELIITMKNCKHESFRHVSLLQVLHKTNDPATQDIRVDGPCYKNEDPVQLLTKVQTTLGKMVKKEMVLAGRSQRGSGSEIEASFQRMNGCKSTPSRSTLSSRCTLLTGTK